MGLSQLNYILRHPDIWTEIAGDVDSFFVEPLEDWDCRYVNGGVIIFHPFRDGVKIHPTFLPGHRGKQAFEQIRENMDYPIIYAEIDVDLRHVNWAARYMGFELIERGARNMYRWSAI